MIILNPITDAAVLALDPAIAGEKRMQSLMRLWLGNYFTGTPFSTRDTNGNVVQKTFMSVDYMWQEDEVPENPQKPLLHIVFTNAATSRMDMKAGVYGNDDEWLLDVMMKLPVNLSATPMAGRNPEHVARELAGQVQWLFSSGERAALAVCGIHHLRVERPPILLPGTSWHMRLMTASLLTRREQGR